MILDYDKREVRVIDPRTIEEAERCRAYRARLELFLEEAKQGMPSDDHPVYGAFTCLFATMVPLLPVRLRSIDEALSDPEFRRTMGMRKDWIAYLNQHSKQSPWNLMCSPAI